MCIHKYLILCWGLDGTCTPWDWGMGVGVGVGVRGGGNITGI
jgi:hypothetical protein